jgi:hypothetical protein
MRFRDIIALAPLSLLGFWFAPWMFVAASGGFAIATWLLSWAISKRLFRRED